MPGIVKYVGDRDMWKFAYLQTKAITEAAGATLSIDKIMELYN